MTSTHAPIAPEWEGQEPEVDPLPREPFAFRFPAGFRPIREGGLVCATVAVAVTWALKLWDAPFRIPWNYYGDGTSTLETTKSILASGWNLHNPRVGAPFVASTVDFPTGGESVHWLSIKLLGYVLRSPVLTDNVYLLLGYFLVALTAFYVARFIGLRLGVALLVGLLYAFLPFHQANGEAHLARTVYYIVPLVILVMLWVVCYRTQLYRPDGQGRLLLHRGRIVFALVVCIIQGVSDTNTSGFAICLLLVIGVLVAAANRDARPFLWGCIFAAAIGVTLVAANTPYVVARLTEGANLVAANRPLSDQELYGLRLALMLLPVEGHRVGFLAHLTAKAHMGETGPELGQSLGLLGVVGFLGSAIAAFAAALNPARERDSPARSALRILGVISLVAVLLGTVGGLSYVIAVVGIKMLRVWDRIVVIIGFVAYLGLGFLLQRGLVRLTGRVRHARSRHVVSGRLLGRAVVVVLAVVGVADQVAPYTVPAYAAIADRYNIDSAFFRQLEAMVPPESLIFQYPIIPYPEAGQVGQLQDYGEFVGYLHTSTLRWSYGGMKGRNQGDWQAGSLAGLPLRTAFAALTSIGFQGIWVDREGYADGGIAFEARVRALLGPPRLVSADQRMAYYDLAPMSRQVGQQLTPDQQAQLASGVLHPPTERFGNGFYDQETAGTDTFHWAQKEAELQLTNPSKQTTAVDFTANVGGNGPGRLTIRGPDGQITRSMATSGDTPVALHLLLRPGQTVLTFDAALPGPISAPGDPRSLWFQLKNVVVRTDAVQKALCVLEQGSTRPSGCR